ncbi:beta-lactamase class C and other penicillin binding protein [Tothia fuscella]|uniref:Beta-lactamase class C and other penicillin binding protein n=1 Tax=Tothia fuscella TaxID=1048955 RepID=A0A9P4NSP8_9PEZI|nr:beta-lactamase class C and other penicillin binding protein [Tothia fuscella]
MTNFASILAESTKKGGNDIPGVVLQGIDKKGKTLYVETSGFNSVESDAEPIKQDGIFKVASCTKLITTIAALQCVERGLIGLGESVYKLLPELAGSKIISSPDNSKTLEYADTKKAITLRHLLTHSSGISYDANHPLMVAWRASRGERSMMNGTVPQAFTLPLLFEPGKGWVYGGGIDWAGYIVKRLNNNITLEQYFIDNIWKPVGRTSPFPTFDLSRHPYMKARLVKTAERRENGSLEPGYAAFAESPKDEHGGSGLAMEVSDFTAVLADLVSDSTNLLKPETITAMYSPQFLPGSAALKAPADSVNFGLGGLLLTKHVVDVNIPQFTLAWGGYSSLVWMANREKGVAAMYASQVVPPGEAKSTSLITSFFIHFRTNIAKQFAWHGAGFGYQLNDLCSDGQCDKSVLQQFTEFHEIICLIGL